MRRFALGVTDGVAIGIGVALVAVALGYLLTKHDKEATVSTTFPLGRGPITTVPRDDGSVTVTTDRVTLPGDPTPEAHVAQDLKSAARSA